MIDITAPLDQWLPVEWYGAYLEGLPDLCVGRWPPEAGRTGAAAWKLWVCESPQEQIALRAALRKPVPISGGALDFRSGPDRAVSAPGRLGPFVALYAPMDDRWPWITLVASPGAADLHRACYAYDIDMTESAALDRIARMRTRTLGATIHVPPEKQSRS